MKENGCISDRSVLHYPNVLGKAQSQGAAVTSPIDVIMQDDLLTATIQLNSLMNCV